MPPVVKRIAKNLPAVLGVLLLFGAIYVVQREFRHLNVRDVGHALSAIPRQALLLGLGLTVAAYGILTFYDRLGTIYAGRPVSHARAAFASFCAYALAHNLGFSAFSGAAVRYRLYAHWGLSPAQIGRVVAFCSLTFSLGGMTLGGGIFLFEPRAVPFIGEHLPPWLLHAMGAVLWAIAGGYVTLAARVRVLVVRGRRVELPNARMALGQVLLATLDVATTAAIFYVLLPHHHGLTYVRFLAVYLMAYSAGLIAALPGGLGVFDTAILLGLAPYVSAPVIVGATFVYRLYYYVIPLFLAGTMFAGNEVLLRSRRLWRPGAATARWSEPDLAVAASTGAVALCGVMLLSVGLLDTHPDFSWIDPDFAQLAASAGQFVPSLLGAALMVLTIGLAQRVTLAWWCTIALLLVSSAATALAREPHWVPAALVVAAVSIAPFRAAYYRHARLISQPLRRSTAVPLMALLVSLLWLASFEPRVRYLAQTSWWQIVISPDTPMSVRAALAVAVVLAASALWGVMRPGRVAWVPWSAEGRLRYAALGALPPVEADGLVMGEAGRAGVVFRRAGGVLLALGDPAGAESDRVSAIWRLRDLAAQEGLEAAVWQASPALLKVYLDLGLRAVPLGADGLPSADAQAGCRYLCIGDPSSVPELMPLLSDPGRPKGVVL